MGGPGPDVLAGYRAADLRAGSGRDENRGDRGVDRCRSPQSGVGAYSCER